LNRADPAAKKLAGTMAEVVGHSNNGAHAMQQIKNALLGIAGVPHLQAVESLTQLGGAGAHGPPVSHGTGPDSTAGAAEKGPRPRLAPDDTPGRRAAGDALIGDPTR